MARLPKKNFLIGMTAEKFAERLNQVSLAYISRYAASQMMLKRVLDRHLLKYRLANPDEDLDELKEKIIQLIKNHTEKGWVNDTALAESLIRGAKAAGLSRRKTALKLQSKDIAKDVITQLLPVNDEQDFEQAKLFAQRKKIGIYGNKTNDPNKDIGKLCRAGFSLAIARKLIKY